MQVCGKSELAGDGGSGNDPGNRAQNLNELLGKMLRIDVDGDDFPGAPHRNYAIPTSNPFVGRVGVRPEIWSYGLRNPWRCSFDRQTGDLFISDVGQGEREEIDFHPTGSTGGVNYGWRLKEGTRVTGLGPIVPGLVEPIHEYTHDNGEQAIVGGYVYRGAAIPSLQGAYFFADYTGLLWSLRYDGMTIGELTSREGELFPNASPLIASFGEDGAGELYVVTHSPGSCPPNREHITNNTC